MADRNVVGSNTFEQFRVEFNELATDVGDIASITGASGIIASATDVIEAITTINTSVGNELDLPDSSGVNVGRIKLGDSVTQLDQIIDTLEKEITLWHSCWHFSGSWLRYFYLFFFTTQQ